MRHAPSFSSVVFCYSPDIITLFLLIHHFDTFFFMIVVKPWCKIVAPWSAILMAVVLFAIQYPSFLLGSTADTAGGGMNSISLYKYIAFNAEITWLNYTFDINHQSISIHLISFIWCRWGIFNCNWCTSPAVRPFFNMSSPHRFTSCFKNALYHAWVLKKNKEWQYSTYYLHNWFLTHHYLFRRRNDPNEQWPVTFWIQWEVNWRSRKCCCYF